MARVTWDQQSPIRVFLLDDHEVVRRGVADVLESDADITVIGEGKNASEALARVPALNPDVAILDVRLPDGDGVTVCRELCSRMPELRVSTDFPVGTNVPPRRDIGPPPGSALPRHDGRPTGLQDREDAEEAVVTTPTVPDSETAAPRPDDVRQRSPRIVAGVDGSDGARTALVWAWAEAARRGAELEVLSAFPVDFYWLDASLMNQRAIEAVRADTEHRARALVEEVRRDPAVAAVPGSSVVPVQAVVAAGAPAEHLVQRAGNADLLVVGSRGRTAARSMMFGSVALHCATHAPCAVVVVHAAARAGAAGAGYVVVGLDDSDMARAVLSAAVAEAARLGAEVEAVVAYEGPDYWSDIYVATVPPAAETQEHAQRRGEQIVAEVLGEVADGGKAPKVHVVAVEGPAGPALVRQAEGAALLVVGSRSRSRLTGMVLGSVALHCVLHGSGPVMVVRGKTAAGPVTPLDVSASV